MFHGTYERFEQQQERDQHKNDIVEEDNYYTILIRLKSINRFDIYHLDRFQGAIIEQFYEATGIRIAKTPILIYDTFSHEVRPVQGPMDRYLGNI